jgi:hypothetical protein
MNGESVSASCRLESAACSTEATVAATKAMWGQRFRKAWAGSWKSLARMWASFTSRIERMIRLCDIVPAGCRYPL